MEHVTIKEIEGGKYLDLVPDAGYILQRGVSQRQHSARIEAADLRHWKAVATA